MDIHLPLHEFDSNSKAIINPEDLNEQIENFPKTVVSCFARSTFQRMINNYPNEIIAITSTAHGEIPIYRLQVEDKELAAFNSQVGSPACVAVLEDLWAMGMERLILFGTCGVLDDRIEDVSIIIPNQAIRDEGTSFHYLKPSYEMEVNQTSLASFQNYLNQKNISSYVGKVWTTDAIYRETIDRYRKRKEQGGIGVDMECSAVAAWAQFRSVEVCHFFYAADHLNEEVWDSRSLANDAALDSKDLIAQIAVDFALKWT
ncbi:nucleoside phosphorylase [Facklamia sp. 7083-14-GEN3]|uniref:nucleoside phosphorylase n=1 Tax=Facklamia sp. 7083-14-GEN3 TaxID=2973478 RepID=UPI00215C37B5|nr:nucleoside phosphorylase [Facklamia sp. 7083-14-GEN3]MCR8969347.1 nucleoside phosphorylase [Facklamia sp. 7083-14-GEN3]